MNSIVLLLLISAMEGYVVSADTPLEKDKGELDFAKVSSQSYFYNIMTNQTLGRRPPRPGLGLAPFQVPFGTLCNCDGPQCSCCAGVKVIGIGFEREACAVLTYLPEEVKIDVNLKLNNSTLYRNKISATDNQLCLPVIPITLMGPVDWCVRLHSMRVVGQRLHTCLAMLVRVARIPFLTLEFNCMEMGVGGVIFSRPGGAPLDGNLDSEPESTPTSSTTSAANATTANPQQDSDVYDAVTENLLRENLTDPRDILIRRLKGDRKITAAL